MALARSKCNNKQNIGVIVRMKNPDKSLSADIEFWLGAIVRDWFSWRCVDEKSKEKIIEEILKRLLK